MDRLHKHGVCLKGMLLLYLIWHSQINAATHVLQSIEQKVYQFIMNQYKNDKPKITIHSIDKRLKLNQCSKALQISWQSPAKAGRNLIKVQCNTSKKWKLYIPVKIEIFKPVYVAKTDIGKGETVSKLNTRTKLVDIGKLHRGYIENITLYDEKKTRRNIRKDEVLNHHLFEIQYAVKRGQQIILESGNKDIAVKVKATALNNGQKGDLIKVRNNSSSIIVEAIIKDQGKAKVIY